ncbi:MAG: DUF3052 family protein [Gemmatimonadota bacterium]
MTAGYSGTPLVQKLGIKPGMRCAVLGPPEHYRDLLIGLPDDVNFVGESASGLDFVHLFVRGEDGLMDRLRRLREKIAQNGMIWVSWPKKAAGVRTDLTEDLVRQAGLSAGLVDVKVCAVDEIWSGLKFVIRKADRR